jgi:D-ribose pyranose/furanose isomerase RbsD
MKTNAVFSFLLSLCCLIAFSAPQPYNQKTNLASLIQSRLPSLGHRNWIVVADSAYPLQISAGVETIVVSEDQLKVVKEVLRALSKTKHVRPHIYRDAEMDFVDSKYAPGITAYKKSLNGLLKGKAVDKMLHEQIIAKLDEAGKTFKVLLIKTPLTVPYTSVFFQLECGYWSDSAEKQMRAAMQKGG